MGMSSAPATTSNNRHSAARSNRPVVGSTPCIRRGRARPAAPRPSVTTAVAHGLNRHTADTWATATNHPAKKTAAPGAMSQRHAPITLRYPAPAAMRTTRTTAATSTDAIGQP